MIGMRFVAKCTWTIVLVTFVMGCASQGYDVARITECGSGLAGVEGWEAHGVRKGMTVRILLVSGEEVSGDVIELDQNSLVLVCDSKVGAGTRQLLCSEIESIEAMHARGPERGLAIVLLCAAAVGAIWFVSTTSSLTSN